MVYHHLNDPPWTSPPPQRPLSIPPPPWALEPRPIVISTRTMVVPTVVVAVAVAVAVAVVTHLHTPDTPSTRVPCPSCGCRRAMVIVPHPPHPSRPQVGIMLPMRVALPACLRPGRTCDTCFARRLRPCSCPQHPLRHLHRPPGRPDLPLVLRLLLRTVMATCCVIIANQGEGETQVAPKPPLA